MPLGSGSGWLGTKNTLAECYGAIQLAGASSCNQNYFVYNKDNQCGCMVPPEDYSCSIPADRQGDSSGSVRIYKTTDRPARALDVSCSQSLGTQQGEPSHSRVTGIFATALLRDGTEETVESGFGVVLTRVPVRLCGECHTRVGRAARW